jgi:hypothetical protein
MCLLPQRRNCRRRAGEDCVRRQRDQFCRVSLEESWIVCSKAIVDVDILILDLA